MKRIKPPAQVGYNPETRAVVEALLKQGMTNAQMAEFLGATPRQVHGWRQKWPLPSNVPRADNPLSKPGAKERMEALLKQGMTDEAMAETMGVKVRTLRWWKRRWGLQTPKPLAQPEARERVEGLLAQGKTNDEIADELGVVPHTVYMARRRWGLEPAVEPKRPPCSCAQLGRMLAQGATDAQLVERLGVPLHVVRQLRTSCGLVNPSQAKLPATRKRLEKLLVQRKTYAECAAALEVSESTIYNWARKWGLQPKAGRSA